MLWIGIAYLACAALFLEACHHAPSIEGLDEA